MAASPANHPARARHLSNLGLALRTRFERTGGQADLDEAIDLLRDAVAASPADYPARTTMVSNLGGALRTRFERTRVLADLDEAVAVGRDAVAASPADHPGRAEWLSDLGVTLQTRFERTGVLADLDEAIDAGRKGVAVEVASPRVRAVAARNWGYAAAVGERWQEAVAGFAAAVGLLGRVAPRSLARRDQEQLLEDLGGLASETAACCVHAGQAGRAVELFEQGRGVLLGQALDTRTDVTALAEQHPQLAAQFIRLRDALDSIPSVAGGAAATPLTDKPAWTEGDPAVVRREIDRRRELVDQFDQVVAEIRDQPGFDRFLLPLPVGELLSAADRGPVVLINVSDIRSDALILTPTGVQVVPLPGLTPQTVADGVMEFMIALDAAQRSAVDVEIRHLAEAQLARVLGWLWDAVAGPVLGRLGLTGPPDVDAAGRRWPRLWWCPSGLLAFLPLHAAGYHATRRDAAPQTVLDRVVSSYTPTVRALIHARHPGPAGTDGDAGPLSASRVVVAMPHTPGAGDLPGAVDEAVLLRDLLPGQVTILHGDLRPEEAARLGGPPAPSDSAWAEFDRVRAALRRCRWAHFACHGASDLTNPSASRLLLQDHQRRPLTVVDVARLRLEGAELAFLSACATARTGIRLADEAIHLAAGFQLAGYRQVIATLWPIGDRRSVRIATDIYTALVADRTAEAAARVLHAATRRLRAVWFDQPSVWAAHIHHGA